MASSAAKALLTWYEKNARDLPWRRTRDPYAIWVSEVMLQQTRVSTVLPYYQRWMQHFPTVRALAEADLDQVLSLWEGLGYYHRAHHLHRAAKHVVASLDGRLPVNIDDLQQLPGVGRYIAAAIAALAFNREVIALDGNLRRVISRVIDLDLDPRSPEGERQLLSWADEVLPTNRASAFNQALMDLGALICRPQSPDCPACPIQAFCQSFARGTQASRPVRSPKRSIPHREVAAGVLWRDGKVLIGRRPAEKLLGGLWEFPGGTREPGETMPQCLQREWQEELGVFIDVDRALGNFSHAYTHFQVTVSAYACHLRNGEPAAHEHQEISWVAPEDLHAYPMGKIDRAIARLIASSDVAPTEVK